MSKWINSATKLKNVLFKICFEERRCQKDWAHPVQIYTACLSKLNRAGHPQAIFHLLPTYINNSEAEPRTNTNRHNRVHMVATLFRLTFILPDETCCLYLERSVYNTLWTPYGNNTNLFFCSLWANAPGLHLKAPARQLNVCGKTSFIFFKLR